MVAITLTPRWFEEQHDRVTQSLESAANRSPLVSLLSEEREQIETVDTAFQLCLDDAANQELIALAPFAWRLGCDLLRFFVALRARYRRGRWWLEWYAGALLSAEIRQRRAELDQSIDRLAAMIRTVQIAKPEWGLELPADLEPIVWTVRVSPFAYSRAMLNMFWSAIRHPLSETTIDLNTGCVLYRT